MDRYWFLFHNNFVQGPMALSELDSIMAELKDSQDCLIWWRGQSEWVSAAVWKQNLPQILKEMSVSPEKKIFYLDQNGERVGPLSLRDIVERLKAKNGWDDVRLWSNETRRWQSVYDIDPLCEALGVTRRAHPRVPMIGSCVIHKDTLRILAPLTSISIGGIGAKLEQNTSLSGIVTVELRSPSLFNSIKTRAEVAYVRSDGSLGLKFQSLSSENQAALIEYIKNFELSKAA